MPDDKKSDFFRRILALALPTVAYYIIEMSLGLADLFMVRSYGETATAALGLNRQITFLLESMILAVSVGVVTLISQGLGRKDKDHVEDVAAQSLLAIVGLATMLTAIGFFLSKPILLALQASDETVAHGAPYLKIYFFGMIFLGVNAVGSAIFRAAKDPWTPLKISGMMCIINIPLNYLLIHGGFGIPAFDVRGAALGTLIARVLASLAFITLLLRGFDGIYLVPKKLARPDFALMKRILDVGFPVGLAAVMRNGARLLFLSVVGFSTYGVALHAGVGLGLQVRLLCVMPAFAFQIAVSTLVGDAIGRKQIDEAEATVHHSMQLLGVIMAVMCGIILITANPIANAFIVDPDAAKLAGSVLRWFTVGQFFSCLAIVAQGGLSGAGDTKPVARITFVTQWLMLVPLAYVLLVPFGMDPLGPLISWAVTPVITFALIYGRFLGGAWKKIRV